MWELCDGARTVPDVVDLIAAEQRIPPDAALAAVQQVIVRLALEGLLVEG